MSIERTVPAPGNWAFWKYDQYPYLLGGEITAHRATGEWHRRDLVYIGSFQSYFRPEFVVGPNDGPGLREEIERLRSEYAEDIEQARKRADQRYASSPFGRLLPRAAK